MLLPARETLKKVTALWRRRHAPTQGQPIALRDLWRDVIVWHVTAADAERARESAIQQAIVTQTPIIVKVVSDEQYHSLLLEDQEREHLLDEY